MKFEPKLLTTKTQVVRMNKRNAGIDRFIKLGSIFSAVLIISGCAGVSASLPSAGPSAKQITELTDSKDTSGIQLVQVDDTVARKLLALQTQYLFSDTFGSVAHSGYVVGAGDVIEVSIWEAPPAALFGGSAALDPRAGPVTTRVTTFPEQMVNSDGAINIPFAGQINASGRTPFQIEAEVVKRLKGKANQPQVLVRIIHNNTANVTVVGEVASSTRMPLTARGERLLDALAAAGGVRQPVSKMTVQITRDNNVQALPLDIVIRDPKQNIILRPGDVITSMYQPLSFTALGATGKNEEINFEAQGISLAQAIARSGGLNDAKSDSRGVFIFRFEEPAALDWKSKPVTTPEGKVPVIYQLDLKNPASFFLAQSFAVKNKDVLYVSNAPAAEFQKFLNLVTSVVYPALTAVSIGRQ